jgi:hypothetical protein
MGTTRAEISRWFDDGVRDGKLYMIVVCDTFDYEDYPVYVSEEESFDAVYAKHNGENMQKIMEVYDLSADKGEQLAERRAFHYPSDSKFAA